MHQGEGGDGANACGGKIGLRECIKGEEKMARMHGGEREDCANASRGKGGLREWIGMEGFRPSCSLLST